ncbi:MAG: hypothetical protein Fur0023_06650 [Bacteroidia bacterium]
MPYTIPIKLYTEFQNIVGEEKAKVIVETLEESIKSAIEEKNIYTKTELKDELKNELATKYDVESLRNEFKLENGEIRKEIDILKKEIDILKKEIDISKREMRLYFLILAIMMVFLNQNALELIFKVLGIIK